MNYGDGTAASLGYDPMLRLHQIAGAATTRFAYDGLAMIAEYNGSNALQRRFVHSPPSTGSGGPGMDQPIVWYEGSGTTDRRFLSSDERGSIISVSDGIGAMLNLNRYDDFGKPQSTNVGRFQYTGQTWLPEVGLYYYKARMYAPHLPRFLQTDPIGYEGGLNLYPYVGNDPINLVDPLGLDGVWDCSESGCEWREDVLVNGTRLGDQNSGGANIWARGGGPGGFGDPGGWGGAGGGGEAPAFPPCTGYPCANPTSPPPPPPPPKPRKPPKYYPKKNYCGPEGGASFPRGTWNGACYNHDICYGTIGAVKDNCDSTFFWEISRSCFPIDGRICVIAAISYFAAVNRLGDDHFTPYFWRQP